MQLEIEYMTWDESGLLGPMPRVLLWLHGCDRHCPGCIAADWNSRAKPTLTLSVETVVETILAFGQPEGVTISGGEPFRQCEALERLVMKLRSIGLGIILYTGYTLEELQKDNRECIAHTLAQCDVLIDGPYIQDMDDSQPFRGSSNQVIHHFSHRYKDYFSSGNRRQSAFRREGDQVLLLGIPDEEARERWAEIKRCTGE